MSSMILDIDSRSSDDLHTEVVAAFLRCRGDQGATEEEVAVLLGEFQDAVIVLTLYEGLVTGRFEADVENGKVLWSSST